MVEMSQTWCPWLQKGFMCQAFGKSQDTLAETVMDLIQDKLRGNEEQLEVIVK